MRTFGLPAALLLLMAANSCVSYYYVTTDIHEDLSADRTVYAETEDGGNPFYFITGTEWTVSKPDSVFTVDFYESVAEPDIMAHRHIDDLNGFAVLPDEDFVGNPLVNPTETLSKRNRWFYTYYEYKAVFPSLRDSLPLPFEGYMSEDRLRLFFEGSAAPQRWNGVEMYVLLDEINQDFVKWYSDAVYFVCCDVIEPYCNKNQKLTLDHVKEDFMRGIDRAGMLDMKPDEFVERLDHVSRGSGGFEALYQEHAVEIEAEYASQARLLEYFDASLIYSVSMPGRYVLSDADTYVDGNPRWKVDAYRLLYDDVVLTAVTRKTNIWAFLLTFAAITAFLVLAARYSRRK